MTNQCYRMLLSLLALAAVATAVHAVETYEYEILCEISLSGSQVATYETCTLQAFQEASNSVMDGFVASQATVVEGDLGFVTTAIVIGQQEVLSDNGENLLPDVWTRRTLRGARKLADSSAFKNTFDATFEGCLSGDRSFKKTQLKNLVCSGFRKREPLQVEDASRGSIILEDPSTSLLLNEGSNLDNTELLPEEPLPEEPLPGEPLPEEPLPEEPLPEEPLPDEPSPSAVEEALLAEDGPTDVLSNEGSNLDNTELLPEETFQSDATIEETVQTDSTTAPFRYELMCEISISPAQIAAYEGCTEQAFQETADPSKSTIIVSNPKVVDYSLDGTTLAEVTVTINDSTVDDDPNNEEGGRGGYTYMWNTNMQTDALIPDVFRRSLGAARKLNDALFRDHFTAAFTTCLLNKSFSRKATKGMVCSGLKFD